MAAQPRCGNSIMKQRLGQGRITGLGDVPVVYLRGTWPGHDPALRQGHARCHRCRPIG